MLGWALTDVASMVLKTVINHTRNVQGKDVERVPYPHWVDRSVRAEVVALVQQMVADAVAGRSFDRTVPELAQLDALFELVVT